MPKWKTVLTNPFVILVVFLANMPGLVGSIQEWPNFARSILLFSVLGMNVVGTISIILITVHITSVAWNGGEPYRARWKAAVAAVRRFGAWLAEFRPVRTHERRAYPVQAFIHMPEGQEPPDPVFLSRSNGVKVAHPWRDTPRIGDGSVWACSAFAYPDRDTGQYRTTKPVKGGGETGTFGVQFSPDGESWHTDGARTDDRYSRLRLDGGHLTNSVPMAPETIWDPHAWFELFGVAVTRGRSELATSPVDRFRLDAIREIRAELTEIDNQQPSRGQTIANDVLYSPNRLNLFSKLDARQFNALPRMSYLRFSRPDRHGAWSLVVGSPRPQDILGINWQGVDIVLLEDAPGSGVVDRVAYLAYGVPVLIRPWFLKLFWR